MLASIAGTAGVVGAACVAWQVTRTVSSAATAATFIVAGHWIWMRGVVDVRPDPIASAGLWLGAALMVQPPHSTVRGALRLGLAAALPIAGFLVNPKFPVVLTVLGGWFAWSAATISRPDRRLILPACAPPVLTLLVGMAALLRVSPLGDLLLQVARVNAANAEWVRQATFLDDRVSTPLFFRPPASWGVAPVLAFVGLVFVIAIPRTRPRERRGVLFVALLMAAAFVELRWLYPFPRLWPQYFVTWGFSLAVAFGCAPQLVAGSGVAGVGEVQPFRALAEVASVVSAGALLAAHAGEVPVPGKADAYRWEAVSFLQRNLRPGEPVWIRADFHPIGAPDASYYWTSFADVVPSMMRYASSVGDARLHPAIGDADLPFCRVLEGQDGDLRFISYDWEDFRNLPSTRRCLAALRQGNRLCPTPYPPLFYLRPSDGTCEVGR